MIKEEYSLSLFLLLPLAANENTNWDYYLERNINSLVNGYIGDVNRPYLDKHIILAFNLETLAEYKIKEIVSAENFVSYKESRINGIHIGLYSMEVSDKWNQDYLLILQNNYFNISNEAKKLIMSFWGFNSNSKLYNSLYVKAIQPIDLSKDIYPEEDIIDRNFFIEDNIILDD